MKRHSASRVPFFLFFPCVNRSTLVYLSLFSQDWFPTVQDVLQADWQDVWHSPQPPFFRVFFRVPLVKVFTLFICGFLHIESIFTDLQSNEQYTLFQAGCQERMTRNVKGGLTLPFGQDAFCGLTILCMDLRKNKFFIFTASSPAPSLPGALPLPAPAPGRCGR